ncbi:MAG TPA: UDP-2,3-diacylglucosamine diphosphatase [Rubrivivax sp.]|nr:UDP-2,3-diacylglucosamine diphosphatase [Rubrivivax sp.]
MTEKLPAVFELVAPQGWRSIDFISDLHLCAAMPHTFDVWSAYLRHTPADAVFMLGDLFELWVGDDMRSRAFEKRCLDVLAEASGVRRTFFMAGNRDFLLGPDMLRESGMTTLPDPTLLSAWGRRLLLSHGDALCLDDKPYQAFRAEVRSSRWQQQFLARPLPERLAIAAQIRQASQDTHERRQFDGDAGADVDLQAALASLHAARASDLIHGHTHRPGSEELAPGHCRHVLSDWDMDTAQRAQVLRWSSATGLRRLSPATGHHG